AKNGYFYPPARKEGRLWLVREDADLVWETSQPVIKPNDDPRLMRILTDGSST
ncbi:MAG: excisionase, partial [Hafnia sp.]